MQFIDLSLTRFESNPRLIMQYTSDLKMNMKFVLLIALYCMVFSVDGSAAEIEFNRDIRPILSDKCFACHGPDSSQRKADLRLDEAANATKDRDGYQVVIPGNAKESELLHRVNSDDSDLKMPPPEFGKELTESELKLLTEWINQGANWQQHWSLSELKRPAVPEVKNGEWVRNPIDQFVLSRLELEGLSPSKTADQRLLMRRLSFDINGLPPTFEQVQSYINSPTEESYLQAVDRYLASPAYGERMAVYWLDLVRYADSLGYHGDQVRSVSPYRDYVIESFNNNVPFNQFTIENLAGDLLPEPTLKQKVASTFNRLNRASAEGGGQPKEYLAKYMADRVRTVGAVWMGSTIGCAECHDHKFDPFTTKDFYSLGAFFADIQEKGIVGGANHLATMPVPTPEQTLKQQQLIAAIAEVEHRYNADSPELAAAYQQWEQQIKESWDVWSPLTPVELKSESGSTLAIEDETRIRASGTNPDQETYVVTLETTLKQLSALRVELLSDDKLPAKGPGRADNGNFVINDIIATVNDQSVEWASVSGTFDQSGYPIENLLKNKKQGWAIMPAMGRNHQAILTAKAPVKLPLHNKPVEGVEEPTAEAIEQKSRFTIRIVQNHGRGGHTVGLFRLYAAESAENASSAKLPNPELANVVIIEPEKRTPEQTKTLMDAFRKETPLLADVRSQLDNLRKEKTAVDKSVVTTLVTASVKPRMVRVLPRGDWMNDSGEQVKPNVPAFLPQPNVEDRDLNRLDLANWFVDRRNPLVARTFVNRLWMLYFGHGISGSVDDLGSQGKWPTHPELLDWLADELIDSGWDVKHIVRLIVESNTYRQSSRSSEMLSHLDPYNELYARQSRWRLEAEMVRDNALSISGLLVNEVGGVSAKPYQPPGYWSQLNFPKRTYQSDANQNQYRRGVYTHWQRTFLHPSLLAFDAPAREECTAQRPRSNTPLQALVLLNDPSYVEAARTFAETIVAEKLGDRDGVEFAIRKALSREPSSNEKDVLLKLLGRERERYKADESLATDAVKVGLAPVNASLSATEVAAWMSVTRVILNLHETITRY